jgi:hypothetical protein
VTAHFRCLSVLAIVLAGALATLESAGADGNATVRATRQSVANGEMTVGIAVDQANNLGGFQFVLSWDPHELKLKDVKATDFISQTGRHPVCPDPATEDGATRVACATIDPVAFKTNIVSQTQVAGPAGSGTLAVAHFQVLKGGSALLHLSKVKLVDPYGNELPSSSQDSTVSLGGSSGSRMAVILGVGGGVALLVVAGIGAFVWRARRRNEAGVPVAVSQSLHDGDR